jgi:hypothetical protein
LPDDAAESLRETFVHELAHLARRDVFWNLLRLGASAVFWIQPLLWVLSRRLEATAEEVCDDHVVQLGADRARYAEHLLELAHRTLPPLQLAGVGMVSLRSLLARRVTRILDSSRSLSTRAGTRVIAITLSVGIAGTCFAGLLGVRGSASAAADDQPKSRSTVQGKHVPTSDAASDTVRGQVLRPDGSPAVGAIVTAARYRRGGIGPYGSDADRQEVDRATADADGRFSLTYPRFDPASSEDNESPDRWTDTLVVASMPGLGPAWAGADGLTEDSPLRLSNDEPIAGRIVDLEGRPVAGASIRVDTLWEPRSVEAVNQWFEGLKRVPDGDKQSPSRYFPIRNRLSGNEPALASTATTDGDGRFRLAGLGRDRMVVLDVRGPSITFRRVQVVTRKMERVEGRHLDEPGVTDPSYYGAEATIVAEPGRVIEGFVRDARSNAPLAGAIVTAQQLGGTLLSIEGLINTVTDASGHYQLIGLPKGSGHKLAVYPALDQPYFITEFLEVTAGPGFGPVRFDIALPRGIWIAGRVTDAKTGRPVQAAIHYFPFLSNANAESFPNFRAGSISLYWTGSRYRTDAEGRFRVVGLPGRGIVAAKSFDRSYRLGIGADTIPDKPGNDGGRVNGLPTYNSMDPNDYQAVAVVEPPAGSSEFVRELLLEPSPALTVNLVDPEGKPLTGSVAWGRFPEPLDHGDHNLYSQSQTKLVGLDPARPRTVLFEHRGRKLGAVLLVKPGDEGERTITLKPGVIITGKVVDGDGKPVTGGVEIRLARAEGERSTELPLPGVPFAADGTFRIESLPAGGVYTLRATNRLVYSMQMKPEQFKAFELARALTVESGQTIALGTFSTATGKRVADSEPKTDAAK